MAIEFINIISKIIVGKPSFSDQLKKIIKRYERVDTTWISCDSMNAWF